MWQAGSPQQEDDIDPGHGGTPTVITCGMLAGVAIPRCDTTEGPGRVRGPR